MRAASLSGARRLYVATVASRSSRNSCWRGTLNNRGVTAAAERRRMSSSTVAAAATASSTSTSSSSSSAAPFSLYRHPRLYDAAFAFRDFEAEARFLVDAWEKYGEGESKNLTSFLDVGAGTGRHGAALAKISTSPASSLSLFALDASAEMLSAASKAAEEAGCPLKQAIRADMTDGKPFGIDGEVQVALCALGTLAHAVPPTLSNSSDADADSSDPALDALRAVSFALVPGGILILELPAAGDLFDGTLLVGDAWDVPPGEWQREDEGDDGLEKKKPENEKRRIGQISKPKKKSTSCALIIEYGSPDDDFDPVSQVLMRTVVVSEARDDGSAGAEIGREVVPQRLFTPAEVRCLAREAGFGVAAELGDMELQGGEEGEEVPSAREGDRYVAVLVKKKK